MRPGVFRVDEERGDPLKGRVRWAPEKSLWITGCLAVFIVAAPFATSISAMLFFLVSTYATLLLGHSVGMHRMLIHRTWDGPLWLKRSLVYLGTLVGMAGPSGVVRIHDVRDWAQRSPECHAFFSHRASFLRDAMWQLHCRFEFDEEPEVIIEKEIADDPFYRFLDATWPLQQIPVAVLLFSIGGWPWVVWGVFGRVFVSVAGHWTVTYLTHNPGPGRWFIPDAGVQASNLPGFGLLTMGECWHNNHHAFPESARIGLAEQEFDPGWAVIAWLERIGLARDVGLPRDACARDDLLDTSSRAMSRQG